MPACAALVFTVVAPPTIPPLVLITLPWDMFAGLLATIFLALPLPVLLAVLALLPVGAPLLTVAWGMMCATGVLPSQRPLGLG